MIVVPIGGASAFVDFLCAKLNLAGTEIRLYDNDYFPTLDSGLADFNECSFPGYFRFNATGWTNAQFLSQPRYIQMVNLPSPIWTLTADLPGRLRVYGFYVFHVPAFKVLFAARFDHRVFLENKDDFLTFNPKLGLLSEFSG